MTLRSLLNKINDAIRPAHVQGQGGGEDSQLDARVTAWGVGGPNAAPGTAPAPVPSQQDDKPGEPE